MKYIIQIQSSIMIDAKTREEAASEVEYLLEDARKRNCGNIDDEILTNATIVETGNRKLTIPSF